MSGKTLKDCFSQLKLDDLWAEAEPHEENLIGLTIEKQWDDLQAAFEVLNIPPKARPFVKGTLIRLAKGSDLPSTVIDNKTSIIEQKNIQSHIKNEEIKIEPKNVEQINNIEEKTNETLNNNTNKNNTNDTHNKGNINKDKMNKDNINKDKMNKDNTNKNIENRNETTSNNNNTIKNTNDNNDNNDNNNSNDTNLEDNIKDNSKIDNKSTDKTNDKNNKNNKNNKTTSKNKNKNKNKNKGHDSNQESEKLPASFNFNEIRYQSKYDQNGLKYTPIPVVNFKSQNYWKYFEKEEPMILKNCDLINGCLEKWTPNYLLRRLDDQKCTVYVAEHRFFRYWDLKKNFGKYAFKPPTENVKMTLGEFIKNVKSARKSFQINNPNAKWYYFQTSTGDFPQLADDYRKWNWDFVTGVQKRLGWGPLTASLLLIGMAGAYTPAHYDEQENIFLQVKGKKEVILFPPSNFKSLYSFPFGHPCDRQSMVYIENPQIQYFPRFLEATPYRAILEPGDVLYLPNMWWHEFTNLTDFCTSITFWSKCKPMSDQEIQHVKKGLSSMQRVNVGRNIEKLCQQYFGDVNMKTVLKGIASNDPFFKSQKDFLIMLLKHVLKDEEVEEFLNVLIKGRYEVSEEQFIAPSELIKKS